MFTRVNRLLVIEMYDTFAFAHEKLLSDIPEHFLLSLNYFVELFLSLSIPFLIRMNRFVKVFE